MAERVITVWMLPSRWRWSEVVFTGQDYWAVQSAGRTAHITGSKVGRPAVQSEAEAVGRHQKIPAEY